MTPEITRVFEIDYGHRLQNHESKCHNTHGHRARIELSCRAVTLDGIGRVIDFSAIKSIFGQWLDDVYDHGFIAEVGDPIIPFLRSSMQKTVILDRAPTIEHIVQVWFGEALKMMLDVNIHVTKLRAYETPNCFADYTINDWKNRSTRETVCVLEAWKGK